jgi:hypothetical protein
VENRRFPRYVWRAELAFSGRPATSHPDTMTPPLVNVSQTALPALAVATSVWLSLLVVPDAGVQGVNGGGRR